MSGYDDLIPSSRMVRVAGCEVEVGVLRMRQLPAFSRAIARPFPLIVAGDYLAVIVEFADDVVAAVSIATGKEAKFLNDLLPHEFLELAKAVFEVNLDFFARAVLPAARDTMAAIRQAMTHSTLPPDSSAADTATATS